MVRFCFLERPNYYSTDPYSFVAAEYANLPLIPPYHQPGNHQFTHGSNFASAGAGALVETLPGYVIDLRTQLSNFENVDKLLRQKLGDAEAMKVVSEAVYLFSIGSNDYLIPFTANSSVLQSPDSQNEFIQLVIGNITTVIKEIYKKGGRKFGLLNLGSLGCLPEMRVFLPGSTGECLEEITAIANLQSRPKRISISNLRFSHSVVKVSRKGRVLVAARVRTGEFQAVGAREK